MRSDLTTINLTTINDAVSGAPEARSELAGAASARGRRFVARSECDQ